MSEAGIIIGDDDEEDELLDAETVEKNQPKEESLADIPIDELKQQLADAIEAEDYEKAAKLRDELAVSSSSFEKGISDGLWAIENDVLEPWDVIRFIGAGGEKSC